MSNSRAFLWAFLASVFCGLSHAEEAAARFKLNIEPQPLGSALMAFGEQSGVQVLMKIEDGAVERAQAPRLVGEFTAQGALEKLLGQSGLRYEFVDDRTVRISAGDGSAAVTEQANLRVAQAETTGASGNENAPSSPNSSTEGAGDSPEQLEEITVTAQRRVERLTDVPISISVLRGEDLDRSTGQGVAEALNSVAGVTTMALATGGAQVTVRGVTAAGTLTSGSSPVGYYLDSAPFGLVKTAIAPDANAYDLDRVEVLRGPQGTLYGAGGVGGVVRVLTRDANLEAFELKGRGAVSSTKDGAENYRGDVALNMPIVAGKLAARAVVGYESWGGWIDKPNNDDANDGETVNLRLKVNAQPTEALSLGLSAWRSRSDFDALPQGMEDGTSPSLFDEPSAIDYDLYGLKVGYDFSAFSLSSATSYLEYGNDGQVDLRPSGLANTDFFTSLDSRIFSQEINLSSTGERPWKWAAGGIYRDGTDRFYQFRQQYVNPLGNRFRDLSESFAVFGELTRVLHDGKFELTGGLRYFEDDVKMQEVSRLTGPTPPGQAISLARKFDALTPRVVLKWHPGDRAMSYVSYSQGFRSGWDDGPGTKIAAPSLPPVEPDKLKNYEIGTKATLWDGRLGVDAAVYYIDWQDIQQVIGVTATSGSTSFPISAGINGESASGIGVDLGLTINPVTGLQLGLTFGWNDLAFDAVVLAAAGNPIQQIPVFDEGDRLNLSPEYTAGVSADYQFPLGAGGLKGRFSASANYAESQEQRILLGTALNVLQSDPLTSTRACFSIESPQHWTGTIYADNLNDEEGTPLPSLVPRWNQRVRPMTIGLQFEYRY